MSDRLLVGLVGVVYVLDLVESWVVIGWNLFELAISRWRITSIC